MAQSVKLTDGSYIDTEGIYDVTQGKTQAEVNALDRLKVLYRTSDSTTAYTFKPGTRLFWIFTREGLFHIEGDSLITVVARDSSRTFTIVWNADKTECTFTASATLWYGMIAFA